MHLSENLQRFLFNENYFLGDFVFHDSEKGRKEEINIKMVDRNTQSNLLKDKAAAFIAKLIGA